MGKRKIISRRPFLGKKRILHKQSYGRPQLFFFFFAIRKPKFFAYSMPSAERLARRHNLLMPPYILCVSFPKPTLLLYKIRAKRKKITMEHHSGGSVDVDRPRLPYSLWKAKQIERKKRSWPLFPLLPFSPPPKKKPAPCFQQSEKRKVCPFLVFLLLGARH